MTYLVFLTATPVAAWKWSDWLLAVSAGAVILLFPWLAHRRYQRSVTAELLNSEVVGASEG